MQRSLTSVERQELAAWNGWICAWCWSPLPAALTGAEADHIIPRAVGGPHDAWNRQILHGRCNQEKKAALTPEARALAKTHGLALRGPLRYGAPASRQCPPLEFRLPLSLADRAKRRQDLKRGLLMPTRKPDPPGRDHIVSLRFLAAYYEIGQSLREQIDELAEEL